MLGSACNGGGSRARSRNRLRAARRRRRAASSRAARRGSAPAQINVPRDLWTHVIDVELPQVVEIEPPRGGEAAIAKLVATYPGYTRGTIKGGHVVTASFTVVQPAVFGMMWKRSGW
mgnify:CR=1 FL=1